MARNDSNPAARRAALLTLVAGLVVATGHSARVHATTPIDLAQQPLFFGAQVPPNVFLQLDDSGSMRSEHLDRALVGLAAYQPPPPPGPPGDNNYNPEGLCPSGGCPAGDDWRESVDFPGHNVLAYVGDPDERSYEPWWDTAYGDADFGDARDWPTDSSNTTDLAGAQYVEWENDSGSSSCPPAGPLDYDGSTTTTCGEAVIDAWDTHRIFTINDNEIVMTEVSFNPNPAQANETVTTTTLGTGVSHPELHGQTVSEVQQRYANWHSYYRTRMHVQVAAVGATLQAFPGSRFGANSFHQRLFEEIPDATSGPYTNDSRTLYDTIKTSLDDDVTGDTPLLIALQRAADYYRGALGPDSPIDLTCQQNFTLLMTDGAKNNATYGDPENIGDADGDGAGTTTLADIAREYYETDLAPAMADDVEAAVPDPASGTPQDQQHMVSFGVAFGVTGDLIDNDSDGWPDTDPSGDTSSPYEVGSLWTDSPLGADYGGSDSLDDLWHMAYNSTGEFLSAGNPDELEQALQDALAAIASRVGSGAAVATTSTSISTDAAIFQALFDSSDWSGNVRRLPVQLTTAPSGGEQVSLGSPDWEAATELDGQNWDTGREILTWNPDIGADGDGVAFRWGELASSQQDALNDDPSTPAMDNDGEGAQRLEYLRGDRSQEQSNGGPYRNRGSVLGDIVHSSPVRVGAPSYNYPNSWPAGAPENSGPSYADFRQSESGRDPMIYVGANDGMMHAFKAADSGSGGEERLAYVPSSTYSHLSDLTDPDYDHHYFVDGQLNYVDAYFEDGGASEWHSVLVGSLRTGGRGIYALDITDPGDFDEANAGDLALWEFTATDDSEMGHVKGSVPVVRLANGEWGAIVGNGYNNAGSGEAVLYIVDVEDGSLIEKINTEAGPSDDPEMGNDRINGLSAPTVIDKDGDGIADYVYAGDLFGNLWKFDIRATNPGSWGIATNGGDPLFEARSDAGEPQPLTARPRVGFHPKRDGDLVVFGTGKYLGASDDTTSGQTEQSIYAIWDKHDGSDVERSDLHVQDITQETTAAGEEVRVLSDDPIDWNTDRGWLVDLDEPGATANNRGERVVQPAVVQPGRVLINTLTPDDTPCGGGGSGYFMVLRLNNGGRMPDTVIDVNDDGQFDDNDDAAGTAVSGVRSNNGLLSGTSAMLSGTAQYNFVSGTGSAAVDPLKLLPPGYDLGRKAWQEIQ